MIDKKEIPQKEITELLNIPIEKPAVFDREPYDGEGLMPRLVQLAERQFDATGPGFVALHIQIETPATIHYSCVWITRQDREEIIKDFREKFDSLQTFCYGLSYGAMKGPGWDALQPRLQVAWQTKANWDAVNDDREAAAAEKEAA